MGEGGEKIYHNYSMKIYMDTEVSLLFRNWGLRIVGFVSSALVWDLDPCTDAQKSSYRQFPGISNAYSDSDQQQCSRRE